MKEPDEGPEGLSKWTVIFSWGCSEQVERVPNTHDIRFMKNGIVGLTKQETGVLEHHTMDLINLRNALINDIQLL
jgi:hypothetical protein